MFSFDVSFDTMRKSTIIFSDKHFGAQKSLHDETVLLSTKTYVKSDRKYNFTHHPSVRSSVRTISFFVFVDRSNISTLMILKILSLSIRLKAPTNKPSQHTMSDQYRASSKTPFKWHFVGGPTLARFLCLEGYIMRRSIIL